MSKRITADRKTMEKDREHRQSQRKTVAVRKGKLTVFNCEKGHSYYNIAIICDNLGCLNSFEEALKACQKYPLTLKPYILEKVRKEGKKLWN